MKSASHFDMSAGFVPDAPKPREQRPLPVSGATIVVYLLMAAAYTAIALWMGAMMAASFCG